MAILWCNRCNSGWDWDTVAPKFDFDEGACAECLIGTFDDILWLYYLLKKANSKIEDLKAKVEELEHSIKFCQTDLERVL